MALEEETAIDAAAELVAMRLTAIRYAAEQVHLYEFRPVSGDPVRRFTAGAHVDLYLSAS